LYALAEYYFVAVFYANILRLIYELVNCY